MASVSFMAAARADSPFAARVVEYSPAPGQWVNDSMFDDPTAALGPPVGGGTSAADLSSIVTLGGFGGSITLAFDHTVLDDPRNAFGMDAIVFGNAFLPGGDPDRHWAECAIIEISLDVNNNGVSDDPWYLIPGSHIADPAGQLAEVTWDDDTQDGIYPPAQASWIPPGSLGIWTTQSYSLPTSVFGGPIVANPSAVDGKEGIFGYADYAPTLILGDLDGNNLVDDPNIMPRDFYTVSDDPLSTGITEGSGGGDAFDIAWAIDAGTETPAELAGFDFIRITTAVDAVHILFGEVSAEIDAVADAAPDPFGDHDEDGDIDLLDAAGFAVCFLSPAADAAGCEPLSTDRTAIATLADWSTFTQRMTGPTQ